MYFLRPTDTTFVMIGATNVKNRKKSLETRYKFQYVTTGKLKVEVTWRFCKRLNFAAPCCRVERVLEKKINKLCKHFLYSYTTTDKFSSYQVKITFKHLSFARRAYLTCRNGNNSSPVSKF